MLFRKAVGDGEAGMWLVEAAPEGEEPEEKSPKKRVSKMAPAADEEEAGDERGDEEDEEMGEADATTK